MDATASRERYGAANEWLCFDEFSSETERERASEHDRQRILELNTVELTMHKNCKGIKWPNAIRSTYYQVADYFYQAVHGNG